MSENSAQRICVVEAFSKKIHDRSDFTCGEPPLDEYLKKQISQDIRNNAAKAYILCSKENKKVIGYYTLSNYAVELSSIPEDVKKKFSRYPLVSATLLGRLAIDNAYRGQGLGEYLLMDAMFKTFTANQTIASAALIVNAKHEKASAFYQHFDFIPLTVQPNSLFLPMATINKLF